MDNTSISKIVRARRLIALGASNRQIMGSEKIAERTIRKLRHFAQIQTFHRPSKVHKCHLCGGRHFGPVCLVCQIREMQNRGVA